MCCACSFSITVSRSSPESFRYRLKNQWLERHSASRKAGCAALHAVQRGRIAVIQRLFVGDEALEPLELGKP